MDERGGPDETRIPYQSAQEARALFASVLSSAGYSLDGVECARMARGLDLLDAHLAALGKARKAKKRVTPALVSVS